MSKEFSRLVEQETLILEATERIAELLDASELRRKDLAKRLGVSKPFVTQVMSGDRNMTLRTLADLAFALGHRIEVAAVPLEGKAEPVPSEYVMDVVKGKLAERQIIMPVVAQRAVFAGINEAVDQIEEDRANANIRAGEYHDRALVAEKRNLELVAALREAPMPFRESVLDDEEWEEAYDKWWHEHASEKAIGKLLPVEEDEALP